ncbi:putative galectin-8-like [Apostichopus japonicus]|uniref:Galectin n=1 Tax=Stichopus japonicus TaxID=307972 RepID=A0A2G8L9J7_STIJA|nr:putative galectin-8-like [Apostichopus japonicus]
MAYPYPQGQQNYVSNPPIPFVGSIPNGVKPGSMIYIQGFVPPGAQRFHINLQCAAAQPPQSDVALHFNPRFPAQVVVRNAMKKQQWLGEEKHQQYFPFALNTSFEIIILVEQNQFKVAVNGQHFTEFHHRVVNLARITHMRIGGQVQVYSIRYEAGAAPAAAAPAPPAGPIVNPRIPYTAPIPGGVTRGKLIYIDGFVPMNAQRFHINLQCGAGKPPQTDVALHFNPRFPVQVVVRNALKKQTWLAEEKGQPYFPFAHNAPFSIIINVEDKQFKIAVNGNHFTEFSHRVVMLKRITHLAIDGQVQIYSIRYEGGSAPAAPAPMAAPMAIPQPALSNIVMNPVVPYVAPIAGGMTPGKMIFISGIVNPNPERFHVNLQCGPRTTPRANVAFHFNPRFQPRKIVRNTLMSQKWGAQEGDTPNFPFLPNSFFEIIVLCQHDAYRVAVNGQHLLEYRHRIAYQQVTFLEVDGAVRLTQIRLQ